MHKREHLISQPCYHISTFAPRFIQLHWTHVYTFTFIRSHGAQEVNYTVSVLTCLPFPHICISIRMQCITTYSPYIPSTGCIVYQSLRFLIQLPVLNTHKNVFIHISPSLFSSHFQILLIIMPPSKLYFNIYSCLRDLLHQMRSRVSTTRFN